MGASDFVRVAAAAGRRPDWYYLVLTVDRETWPDPWSAFKAGYRLWQDVLRKRLERWAGRFAGRGVRMEYVSTYERHKDGWPHVNILMAHPGFAAASELYGDEYRQAGRARRGRWCYKPNWRPELIKCVEGSGFGGVAWIERVTGAAALAGYLTKLSQELVGASAKSQVPTGAPKGFRRLRATRGTLPPRYKAEPGSSEYAWALDSTMGAEEFAYWSNEKPGAQQEHAKRVFEKHGSKSDIAILDAHRAFQALARAVPPDWASTVSWVDFAKQAADIWTGTSWDLRGETTGATQTAAKE